jgi:rod shape-determining protein MreB
MCGGGSLLRGLPQVVSQATGLKVRVAEDPMTCVVRGTGIFLEHLDRWHGTIDMSDEEL